MVPKLTLTPGMLYAYPLDLLSWKTRRQRRHVCAIFQASFAICLPVDTQMFFFSFFCENWLLRWMNRHPCTIVSLSKASAESVFSLAITNIMFDQVASWKGAAARFISGITLYASQILPKPVSSSASKLWKFTPPFENTSIPWRGCSV